MLPKELIELSKVRFDNTKKLLETSQTLINTGDYKSSANRSYYAVFNAMRACLALLKIDHKRHSGVMSDFRLHYIKNGKLKPELSDYMTALFDVRNNCDYNDFYVISKDDVATQLSRAEVFVKEVEVLLSKLWKS
jgi:hypothetical protein